jgi:hypothetical protein
MDAPLAGVRVVEMANVISGPFSGMLLADLGADVVTVELPGQGDVFRQWAGDTDSFSPPFAAFNRRKRSITIETTAATGGTAASIHAVRRVPPDADASSTPAPTAIPPRSLTERPSTMTVTNAAMPPSVSPALTSCGKCAPDSTRDAAAAEPPSSASIAATGARRRHAVSRTPTASAPAIAAWAPGQRPL